MITPSSSNYSFVSIDGEGYTLHYPTIEEEGKIWDHHIYNLIMASDGDYLHNDDGLGTCECFDFILDAQARNPRAILTAFYFSYDVNMMLRDLPPFMAQNLLGKNGFCYMYDGLAGYEGYKVRYLPKKLLSIEQGETVVEELPNGEEKATWVCHRSAVVYDVWGFFQCSFLNALKELKVCTPEDLALIEEKKGERGSFRPEKMPEIIKYCKLECDLLQKCMEKVGMALTESGLSLRSWHGAGAVGESLLNSYGVRHTLYRPQEPVLEEAIRRAYFGGRIQSLTLGQLDEPLCQLDIVSAYPWGMSQLPNLANCVPFEVHEFEPYLPAVIYDVSWNIVCMGSDIGPFPFRDFQGGIHYPLSGRGMYWSYEVAACLDVYGKESLTIHSGYAFISQDPLELPFTWIDEIFAERKRLKQEGNFAQYAYKLALNSVYGKLAQGTYGDHVPRFQCYAYAGMITSLTRAAIFRLSMRDPNKCIAFSTDGVFFRKDPDLGIEPGNNLGDWEKTDYQSGLFIMPGIYFLEGGKNNNKTRGFPLGSLTNDTKKGYSNTVQERVIEEWNKNGVNGKIRVDVRSFIGLKAFSEKRPWRTWLVETKQLDFWPTRGEAILLQDSPKVYRVEPDHGMQGESAPYVGKDRVNINQDPLLMRDLDALMFQNFGSDFEL